MSQFDQFLNTQGPLALVLREHLIPVEGKEAVFFPPTFASIGYNIDTFADGHSVCLVDSVGSQANRIEPIFLEKPYSDLVPDVRIKAGDDEVSLLEVGHRAADAFVRCSGLQDQLDAAFKAVLKGDPTPLAKIAPTSLVFGVWDSRGTQAKLPRIVSSTIRAFDAQPLKRSAQYNPPVDYAALEIFSEEDKQKNEGDPKSPLAKQGFVHVPAVGSHGGIIAKGGIRRDATLGLAALRLLKVQGKPEETKNLQQYILGLALTAFTHPAGAYLRQGTILARDPDQACELVAVHADGRRVPCSFTHEEALAFAKEATNAFGVGESITVSFDKNKAKTDVGEDKKAKKGRGKKAEAESSDGTGTP